MGPLETHMVEAHRQRMLRLYQAAPIVALPKPEALPKPIDRRRAWHTPHVEDFGQSLVTRQKVLAVVATVTGISKAEICGPARDRQRVKARWMAMYLLHSMLGLSLPKIGRVVSRDHTTCLYGLRMMALIIQHDETVAKQIETMCGYLKCEGE